MHRALHRAFGAEPHFLQATVKVVYSISYQLPGKKCVVISHVQQWLRRNAHWEGGRYTSWMPKGCMELRAYEVVWNYDWQARDMVRGQSCSDAACVCVRPPVTGGSCKLQFPNRPGGAGSAGQGPAGRVQGRDWAGAHALAYPLFSCLQGWTLKVDCPNRWCLLAVYLL